MARKPTALTGAMIMACLILPAPPAAADPRPRPGPLQWKACTIGPDDQVGRELDALGARCAEVTVPLDHADPGGRKIKIAISRLRARDPDRRIGAMLLNGGGPGPSLDMPLLMNEIMGEAAARYDLIGMDPRSLGRSAPVDCGWPTGTWIRSAGETRRSFERSVAFAKDLAERCRRNGGEVLPHVSTRNIARDMDAVRAALGERRISYNGASYGTYLGAVYATLFPGRLDRVVLDSAVDPAAYSPRLMLNTGRANERALAAWADWTAQRDKRYGLGVTRAEVLGSVRAIYRAAAREPLRVGTYRLDDSTVPFIFMDGLDEDLDPARAELAGSAAALKRAARGEAVTPSPAFAEQLRFLLTGGDSRYGSGQSAIICGDAPAPRDPRVYWRDVQRARRAEPFFGALTKGINPCAFWPWRPREEPTRVSGRLPSLIVAATGDTRTTYESNQGLHRVLDRSRMVTLPAYVHAPYQRGYPSPCVADTANGYLLTGRLPARDFTC